MRYFLISFAHSYGFGNITLYREIFPSLQTLLQETEKAGLTEISILHIFEFKNEIDFNNYLDPGQ